jgi:flagellar protein FlaI
MLETKVDKIVMLVRKGPRVSFERLSKEVGLPVPIVERICQILERGQVLEINYPVNVLERPFVVYKGIAPEKKPAESEGGKSISTYSFKADNVPATVEIIDSNREKFYRISFVELTQETRVFLDYLKDELLKIVPAESSDVADVERLAKVRADFHALILKKLASFQLGDESTVLLAGLLLHSMFGLGQLDVLTHDDYLEEIAIINAKMPVGVYHRKFGWLKTNMFMPNEEEIFNYAAQIGRRVGRSIAVLTPIMDARLETGDRVNATLAPISSHGNTITIRRFARNPWTIVSLINESAKTMTPEMAAMLWQAIHYELNLIVAGGTASGKTSALNALCAFIPPNQRVLTIEDTRELILPKFVWNWIPLLTRNPNSEGLGEVAMLDLMVTSLRMRPDRIVLGETRKKAEAEVLFEAMHTGHSVCSTFHADTSTQVIRRLTTPPIEVPPSEIESLHLLLVQYRDRRRNLRRTLEISEVQTGAQAADLAPNIVYRWRPRTDTFDKVAEPVKLYKELNLHTGMTKEDIIEDQKKRATILRWMLKNNLSDIDSVGKIMSMYYADPESIYELAKANMKAG